MFNAPVKCELAQSLHNLMTASEFQRLLSEHFPHKHLSIKSIEYCLVKKISESNIWVSFLITGWLTKNQTLLFDQIYLPKPLVSNHLDHANFLRYFHSYLRLFIFIWPKLAAINLVIWISIIRKRTVCIVAWIIYIYAIYKNKVACPVLYVTLKLLNFHSFPVLRPYFLRKIQCLDDKKYVK